MRVFLSFILFVAILSIRCPANATETLEDTRVLFVGNSLTYVGNLPAVFDALASANGHPVASDMIMRGGATLSERVADGSIADAMSRNAYAFVVVQERGGDLICLGGPRACEDAQSALKKISSLSRKHSATAIMFGTYQPNERASRQLVQKETAAARTHGMRYVQVSEHLQKMREAAPTLTWFDQDGMHPGKDLTLLDAVLLYKRLFDSYPKPLAFTVDAPIYAPSSGLTAELRSANAAPPKPDTPIGLTYSADTVSQIIDLLERIR